jgi:hypothetical protein
MEKAVSGQEAEAVGVINNQTGGNMNSKEFIKSKDKEFQARLEKQKNIKILHCG